MSTERAPRLTSTHSAVVVLLVLYGVAYVTLSILGKSFFVYKTFVLPAVLAYGLLLRNPKIFAADWVPLLSVTVLFDACRGAIYTFGLEHHRHFLEDYVILAERFTVGTAAVAASWQTYAAHGVGDAIATALHGSHFLFFILFGLAVWHVNRDAFLAFRRLLVMVMVAGIVCYALWPTVPPWMASRHGLLPPMTRVIEQTYIVYLSEVYGAFDTNPVAAMPSLHAAFPIGCAIVASRWFGKAIGLVLMTYALAVCIAVVYLGEHYVVDILAGVALALVASMASGVRGSERPSLSVRTSMELSAVILIAAVALMAYSH